MSANSRAVPSSSHYTRQLRKFTSYSLVTLFALIIVTVYLMPFANMVTVSLRDHSTLSQAPGGSSMFALFELTN